MPEVLKEQAENIKQMRERHRNEINRLRDSCLHEHSHSMPFGYYDVYIEICDFCEEVLRAYESQRE